MHHLLFATTGSVISAAVMPSSSSSSSSSSSTSSNSKPKSSNHHAHNSNCISHSLSCKHSPSATLDLLILILVLFSGAFLLSSYFSYIFNSLSLLLSHFTPHPHQSHILGFVLFFLISVLSVAFCCCGARSRRCGKPGCKGFKKAMEFDLQLQTEESLRSGSDEIDRLPWKGGTENNPDYECLRSELRNMAPPGGRAVLMFRTKCGCPVAKLEGWGPRKGKRHKKSLPSTIPNGGGDRP